MLRLLLFHSKADFITRVQLAVAQDSTATTGNAYAATLEGREGYDGARDSASFAFGSTVLLIPLMCFFNLWSNWGATLYGEVRGASDFRKNIYAMAGALIATTIAAVDLPAAVREDVRLGLVQRGEQRVLGRHRSLPACGRTRALLAAFFIRPVLQFIVIAAHVAVVLRLGRHGVPVVDARDLRDGVRPHPARGAAKVDARRRPVRRARC